MKYKDLDGNNILDDGARTLNDHGDLKVIGNPYPPFQLWYYGRFDMERF